MTVRQRPGRPEAAEVIWTWAEDDVARNDAAEARQARGRGLLQAAIALGVGTLFLLFLSPAVGFVILGIAGAILLSALISPLGLYAGIETGFRRLGWLLGKLTTYAILVPMFYLVFFPFGALLRRGRRDRLTRFYEPEEKSYWIDRASRPASSLERQY